MSPDKRRLFHRRRIFPSWGHLVHRESCTCWCARSQPFETKAREWSKYNMVVCVEFKDNFGNCKNYGKGDLNLCCPDGGGVATCVVVLLHRWSLSVLCWIKFAYLHAPTSNLAMVSPECWHPVGFLGKTCRRHIWGEFNNFPLARPGLDRSNDNDFISL